MHGTHREFNTYIEKEWKVRRREDAACIDIPLAFYANSNMDHYMILLYTLLFQDSRSCSVIQNISNHKDNLSAYCSLVYLTPSSNYDREGEDPARLFDDDPGTSSAHVITLPEAYTTFPCEKSI